MAKNRKSSDATKASTKPSLSSINLNTAKKENVAGDLLAGIKSKTNAENTGVETSTIKSAEPIKKENPSSETAAASNLAKEDQKKQESEAKTATVSKNTTIKPTNNKKNTKDTTSTTSSEAVVMKNVAVSLLPEDDQYLKLMAAQSGKKINAFFTDLMKEDIALANAGKIDLDDSIVKEYQGKIYGKSRRTIAVDELFTEEIKAAGMKYRMTYTNYVSYVVHKARINDLNW